MAGKLDSISLNEIVVPGAKYVFSSERDSSSYADPINLLYVIEKDREILPAIKLEISLVDEMYEDVKFLGISKISDDCHEFQFECKDIDTKEKAMYLLYLHKIQSFAEFFSNWSDRL